MLVLSRKEGESLLIHDRIKVKVLDIRGNRVRLGVEAPRAIAVLRNELIAELPHLVGCDLGEASISE